MINLINIDKVTPGRQSRALWLSTIVLTLFLPFGPYFLLFGVQIKQELGLNETEFGLLVGTPILTGSLIRLTLGGRPLYSALMISAALATSMKWRLYLCRNGCFRQGSNKAC